MGRRKFRGEDLCNPLEVGQGREREVVVCFCSRVSDKIVAFDLQEGREK